MQLQTLSGRGQRTNPGGNSTSATSVEPINLSEQTNATPDTAVLAGANGVVAAKDGVLATGHYGGESPNGVSMVPYGVGSATNTFIMKVYGWDLSAGPTTAGIYNIWYWYLLASFTCTLCTVAGITKTIVDNTQLFCGTITLLAGNANVSNEIVSPTGNVTASIMLDVKGSRFIETRYNMNSSATSANCLVKSI